MSGGHFDYEDYTLERIADQMEFDIRGDDFSPESQLYRDDARTLDLKPETVARVEEIFRDLRRLRHVLHQYDYFVSGDTSEDDFLECVSKYRPDSV